MAHAVSAPYTAARSSRGNERWIRPTAKQRAARATPETSPRSTCPPVLGPPSRRMNAA